MTDDLDISFGMFRTVLYECLKNEGLENLVFEYNKYSENYEQLNKLLDIVIKVARFRESHGTLEQLHFAGLIY